MPKQCIHRGEINSSGEYYGRETGCKNCKEIRANKMEEDLTELEERVDKININQKHLREILTDIITVQE